MRQQNKYFIQVGITNPAYTVMRIAGIIIAKYSAKYMIGKLVDIGCGEKKKKLIIGKFVDSYGVDHEEIIHDQSNVDMFGADYDIPVENENFHRALCTAVLEHLEEPELTLKKCCSVLKFGGCAIYTIPSFWHLHEEPQDFYRYTKHEIKYLFEKAGFKIVKLKPHSGSWITFGSEYSYYISGFSYGPLCIIIRPVIAMNNLRSLVLNKIDRMINSEYEKWTWMYMIVARKP